MGQYINFSSLPKLIKYALITRCDQLGFDYFTDCISAILTHSDYLDRWDFTELSNAEEFQLNDWRNNMVTNYSIHQFS